MSDDFRRYASLYREVLTANSFAYQSLCFFKIIEGVRFRRGSRNAIARKSGQPLTRQISRLPRDRAACEKWLKAIFYGRPEWDPMSVDEIFPQEVFGRKISDVVENELRPVRVKVAHVVLDSGEPALSADEGLDIQQITKWLPLTKCIARRMLKDEFPASQPNSCRFYLRTAS